MKTYIKITKIQSVPKFLLAPKNKNCDLFYNKILTIEY